MLESETPRNKYKPTHTHANTSCICSTIVPPLSLTFLTVSQDLDWCNIQAEGAMALAQHMPRQVLRLWLGLGGCSIGRDGAKALARALSEMSKLERLHLDCSRCRISCSATKYVKKCEEWWWACWMLFVLMICRAAFWKFLWASVCYSCCLPAAF